MNEIENLTPREDYNLKFRFLEYTTASGFDELVYPRLSKYNLNIRLHIYIIIMKDESTIDFVAIGHVDTGKSALSMWLYFRTWYEPNYWKSNTR